MFAEGSCAAAGGARSWRFRRKATLIASGSSRAIICRLTEQIAYRSGQKARFLVAQRLHQKNWRITHGKGRFTRRVGTVLGAYLAGRMTPAPKLSRGLADGTVSALASKGCFKSRASPLKVATLYISMGESRVSIFWGILTGPPSLLTQ
jgi:hypothetical protein